MGSGAAGRIVSGKRKRSATERFDLDLEETWNSTHQLCQVSVEKAFHSAVERGGRDGPARLDSERVGDQAAGQADFTDQRLCGG